MKTNYLIILLVLLLPLHLFSQTKASPGDHIVSQRTISVKKIPKALDRIYIEEKDNTIDSFQDYRNLNRIGGVRFKGPETIERIFLSTLGETKLNELSKNEKNVVVILYFANSGHVENVQFNANSDTGISLEEFDSILNAIKSNITIEVPDYFDNTKKVSPVYQAIHFKKIIEQTL